MLYYNKNYNDKYLYNIFLSNIILKMNINNNNDLFYIIIKNEY